jgi:hypothetical protein
VDDTAANVKSADDPPSIAETQSAELNEAVELPIVSVIPLL